jgi:hypothetical protein
MSSIRVVVKIPTSIYPELVTDLTQVPLRDRAERLRILALLGLMGVQRLPPQSVSDSDVAVRALPDQKATTNRLIQRLKGSL